MPRKTVHQHDITAPQVRIDQLMLDIFKGRNLGGLDLVHAP